MKKNALPHLDPWQRGRQSDRIQRLKVVRSEGVKTLSFRLTVVSYPFHGRRQLIDQLLVKYSDTICRRIVSVYTDRVGKFSVV